MFPSIRTKCTPLVPVISSGVEKSPWPPSSASLAPPLSPSFRPKHPPCSHHFDRSAPLVPVISSGVEKSPWPPSSASLAPPLFPSFRFRAKLPGHPQVPHVPVIRPKHPPRRFRRSAPSFLSFRAESRNLPGHPQVRALHPLVPVNLSEASPLFPSIRAKCTPRSCHFERSREISPAALKGEPCRQYS